MIVPIADAASPRIDASLVPRKPAIAPGFLIEIGETVVAIYGNASDGWSIEQSDIIEKTPYRSASLDEVVFAILNFCLHARGSM